MLGPRFFAVPVLLVLSALACGAQPYPDKPVKVIVPFPAGGGSDVVARQIADRLSRALGQQFFVENRTGSGGMIGLEAAARSAGDGSTILITTDSLTSAPHVVKTNVDVLKDLAPVIQLTRQPVVLAVHPSLGVNSLAEFVECAKRQPGMGYATSGIASPQSMVPLWFAQIANIKLEPVPYRGGGPALNDVLAGHVKIASMGAAPLIPHYKAGSLRLLAQTTEKRSPSLPDVPTYQEAGIEGLVIEQWFGVFVPAKTPGAIVTRLNTEINRILVDPVVRDVFQQSAEEAVGGTPEQFSRLVHDDFKSYARLVKELNIKAE